ncbi:MAG: exonuclease SbcCD subunit D, partial [Lachnospiraceae bacterium]|nr:exonuclease SbcCD subunit D [Lachnospiraceae bacterium]
NILKFFHLGDLHFGKSIYGLSMLDDQHCFVDRFLECCSSERPDAVVIAGDVYDRSAPSGDAVELLDYFLTNLAEMNISVMLIAGNHDSGQRLSFGRSIMAKQKIHIAGTLHKVMEHVTLNDPDEFGPVTFWLLPYIYPEIVSHVLGDEEIRTYEQALRRIIEEQDIDPDRRNIIVSHQNIVANGREAERGGSESMVGGVGQIDYSAYDIFDYAALGHIHSSYPVGREEVRYAGTPICYHLSETRQSEKGFVEVVLGEKGSKAEICLRGVKPLHRMRYLVGTKETVYDTLRNDTGRNEYIGITLTDERTTPESSMYLRSLLAERGSVLLEFLSDYHAFMGSAGASEAGRVGEKALEDLFSDLYTEQCGGTPPTDDEYELLQYIGEVTRNQDAHQEMEKKDVERVLSRAKGLGADK